MRAFIHQLAAMAGPWVPAALRPEPEKERLAQLVPGAIIGFGFLPQAGLSGRRMRVEEVRTYRFEDEKLLAYTLARDNSSHVQMIIADTPEGSYLALSRLVPERDHRALFGTQSLTAILHNPEAEVLKCRAPNGDYRGWVADSYRKVLEHVRGEVTDGDHREGEFPRETRAFTYCLMTNNRGDYAIEMEQYDDGRLQIYVTAYRPLTDIGQITLPAKPALVLQIPGEDEALTPADKDGPLPRVRARLAELYAAKTSPLAEKSENEPHTEKTEAASAGKENAEVEILSMQKMEESQERAVEEETAPRETPLFGKLNGTHSHPAEAFTGTLACDAKVAARIIEEARRNRMSLADLVRRVVDLPVTLSEKVMIDISLSAQDCEALAVRYGVSATDHEKIKEKIVEELEAFSGVK